eukprot:5078046-Alexandrium_andersonii.AAC.1
MPLARGAEEVREVERHAGTFGAASKTRRLGRTNVLARPICFQKYVVQESFPPCLGLRTDMRNRWSASRGRVAP